MGVRDCVMSWCRVLNGTDGLKNRALSTRIRDKDQETMGE